MYRNQLKVVESFGSIFAGRYSLGAMVKIMLDRYIGGPLGMPALSARSFESTVMRRKFETLQLPQRRLPAMLGCGWLEAMLHWMEFLQGKAAHVQALTLRMDEFVNKDLEKRQAVVEEVLRFASIPTDTAMIERAMAVFGTHSQAGTAMEKLSSAKTGKTFLTESDKEDLVALCKQLDEIGAPSKVIPQ